MLRHASTLLSVHTLEKLYISTIPCFLLLFAPSSGKLDGQEPEISPLALAIFWLLFCVKLDNSARSLRGSKKSWVEWCGVKFCGVKICGLNLDRFYLWDKIRKSVKTNCTHLLLVQIFWKYCWQNNSRHPLKYYHFLKVFLGVSQEILIPLLNSFFRLHNQIIL